jgi:hypothetical protein
VLDRRRFVLLTTLAAAPWLLPRRGRGAPQAASTEAALAVAKQQILTYCATLAFPNGAIHAVRALGRACPLGPGDPFRLLLETCLVENQVRDRLEVEVPVEKEGHRNAMLKTLLEKGCEMDLPFELRGHRYVFRDYVDSARRLVSYPGNLAIDEHSWTIMAMALVTPPGQPRWTNAWGAGVDLERMIDDTSAALERDTELIRRVDLTQEDVPRDCPALARACGGLHMLYALAVALGAGFTSAARRTAFAGHMRTLVRRLVYDAKVTDSVERENQRNRSPNTEAVTYDARVKELGHIVEILGVVERKKLYTLSADERRQFLAARARLCDVLVAGRDLKFERWQRDPFLYDSMTTSICHAYNGLMSWPI